MSADHESLQREDLRALLVLPRLRGHSDHNQRLLLVHEGVED